MKLDLFTYLEYLGIINGKPRFEQQKVLSHIYCSLITHNIGDGINDSNAFQFILAATPSIDSYPNMLAEYKNVLYTPPELKFIKRVGYYHPNTNLHAQDVYDLIAGNFQQGWKHWLLKNSPSPYHSNNEHSPLQYYKTPRESYKLLFPFGVEFRRGQVYYRGTDLDYIEAIQLIFNKRKRRYS